jgi:hypothetical protein
MINDLILRVTYNGVITDLDVDGDVPLRLDISQVDNQNIGEIYGVSSQNFNLPGTNKNNKFFNHGYLESAIDVPGLYDTIECDVLRNGETLLQGMLQLNEVVTSDSGFITYDVTVSNKVVEFNEALKDKFFYQADFDDLNHILNTDNVFKSWEPRSTSTFKNGSIFYPLADYGFDNRLTFPTFPRLSADGSSTTGSSANPSSSLSLGQFLPAIGVRNVFDKIFDQAGYSYSSSLISSTAFDELFILFKNQDALGVVSNLSTDTANLYSGSIPPMTIIPSVAAGDYTFSELLSATSSVYDPGGNLDLVTGYYEAPKDGNYTFEGSVNFTNGSTSTTLGTVYTAGVSIDYIDPTKLPDGSFTFGNSVNENNSTNGQTFNITGSTSILLSQGDKAKLEFFVANGPGISTATDPIDIFTTSYFKVTSAPLSYENLPVSMSLQIDSDVKTIDLFKGLLTQFNLVAYPLQDQAKVIALETFDHWMRSGQVKDWTEKYNSAKRISIKNPVSEEPRELRFSNAEDEDRVSRIAKDQTPNFQYGTQRTLSNSNLTSGEKKVESLFSPTPLAPVVTSELDDEGAVTLEFNNQGANNFIVPHLYKFKNNAQESFKFKPKIGYRTYYQPGETNVSDLQASQTQYVLSGSSFTSFDEYSTLSNYEAYPVQSTTKDLLFNSAYKKFSTISGNPNPALYPTTGSSNFNNYWKNYIDSIYWQDGRKVTMDLFFNEYEYQDIKLNDQIIINDNSYRINKIKGFNLTRRDIVTVELLKLYPVYSPVIASSDPVVTCPTVATYPAHNITSQSMTLSGSLLTVGSGVLEKGFVISETDTTPTIEEGGTKYLVAGTSAGEYDYDLTGLNSNTTYYYQAYVSSSEAACSIAYGGVQAETTLTASNCDDTVSASYDSITTSSFNMNGTITQVGSAETFVRGFVYSSGSDTNPIIGGTGVTRIDNGTTYGAYTSAVTSADCNTNYYFKAFQSQSGCIKYSDLNSLTTTACPSTGSCLPFNASGPTNFGGACSETITQTLYTDYSGSWPPTQAYLDGGGVMTVYTSAGCSVASPNTYYAFDSSSATGTDVNSFLRVDDGVGDGPGDVINIYDCTGP